MTKAEEILEELKSRDLVSDETIREIEGDITPNTKEVWRNGKRYLFEWNEVSIRLVELCDEKTECLETYDFALVE